MTASRGTGGADRKPIKVAILGGGCAAITAAFELTRATHRGRFEVTVYQMGWRLGGKGASGRGAADRIEEHGLHLWMGFYENAFQLMRECYAELARDPLRCRIASWRDAFVPATFNAVADRSQDGGWIPWRVLFPPTKGLPGDPAQNRPLSVAGYLIRCVSLLRTLIASLPGATVASKETPAAGGDDPPREPPPGPDAVMARIGSFMKYGELVTWGALIEGLHLLELAFRVLPVGADSLILALHTGIARAARKQLATLTDAGDDTRRLWEIIDLVLAVLRGAIRFKLLTDPRGFDAINEYDCREWLILNGASERSINSAFVRALYDLAFAYEDGDVRRPRIAAGQALRGAVRAFFTYRGAFFWKMCAGMGDVVFAPFYEVLQRRGVRFEFFHRLQNLELGESRAGEAPYVAAIDLDVQAQIRGDQPYRPLVDVKGLPCWPSHPDFDQLVDGDRMKRDGRDFESPWDERRVDRKVLRVGEDFDLCVLGVGIGAIPDVCRDIVARDPRWNAMVRFVKSVPTQAFQIWLSANMSDLGWRHGPANVSGFVEPFDTWADMSHLISEENFRQPPAAIAYFCSVLSDQPGQGLNYAHARHIEVKRNAQDFLNREVKHLWPQAEGQPGRFRWDLLVDPVARAKAARKATVATKVAATGAQGQPDAVSAGSHRFDSQYWRANVNPSDRYTLSLPGSLIYRISPLDQTYSNLTVAGDWTDCGFNEGCVEAAVMSGRLAAHALSQFPALNDIVGFDHP